MGFRSPSRRGNGCANQKLLAMIEMPPRPNARKVDYDDGDPYSCIAAARAEQKAAEANFVRVTDCFEAPPEQLQRLLSEDRCGVKAALYDIWENGRLFAGCRSRGEWAARQMAELGDTSLLDYNKAHPVDG